MQTPRLEPARSPGTVRTLDWCCIGAQKAGTSTLFRLLREHPDLFIPPGKEEPLFHRPVDDAEVAAYWSTHFTADQVAGRRAGTVTPQYMSSPETAVRAHAACPDLRVIVLLREPSRRALSHYRMNVRRGTEQRSFADAIHQQLTALEAGPPEDPDDECATYVHRGRYAHILGPWFDLFGRDRILVVFVDDLERSPVDTLHSVHRFLGVQPHTTGLEGLRSHVDPPAHRFSGLRRKVAGVLRRAGILERIPSERREQLAFRIESLLARLAPRTPDEQVERASLDRLRDYYSQERDDLQRLLGRPVPWS